MQNNLSWTSGLSFGIYIYAIVSILLALGLWFIRRNVLREYASLLFLELPALAEIFQDAQQQLRQVNRQVDRGMDQLGSVFDLVQGLFLALLETRVIAWIMRRIHGAPLPIKMVTRKGIEQAFRVVYERIKQMNKDIIKDEAAS
jgi:hypothetical protein